MSILYIYIYIAYIAIYILYGYIGADMGPIWANMGESGLYLLYMRVCFPGRVLFEIFDPPEARFPSRGQRTCFVRDL